MSDSSCLERVQDHEDAAHLVRCMVVQLSTMMDIATCEADQAVMSELGVHLLELAIRLEIPELCTARSRLAQLVMAKIVDGFLASHG